MTIDEAIEKEKGIIKQERIFQDTHVLFVDDDGEEVTIEILYADDTECIEEALQKSKKYILLYQTLMTLHRQKLEHHQVHGEQHIMFL